MSQVWKVALQDGAQHFAEQHMLPVGAVVLSVEHQRSPTRRLEGVAALVMWVLVNPDAPVEIRTFKVFGTGHDVPANMRWLGTTQHPDMRLVWHVFEPMP